MSGHSGLLDNVLENIIQGVVMFDSDQNLRVWNRHYQKILQFPDGYLKVGRSNYEMALFLAEQGVFGPGNPPDLAKKRLDLIWGAAETRTSITINEKWIYEVLCKRTPDGGLVITYTDVTERENSRDRLSALNEHKDKFFMLLAHDLRGPFNALLGYSDLLQGRVGQLEPKQVRDFSGQIHRAAADAYKLLEDLLDWTSVQLGGYKLSIQPVDLELLVEANISRYQPIADTKAILIRQTGPAGITIPADPNMLDTILRNLISNAIKFSPVGGRIEVSVQQIGPVAGFSVRDRGVGIPPDRLEGLFRFGAEGATKGTQGEAGTGLGLHLCKEMVDMLAGEIQVDSTPGEGTVFRVLLPVKAAMDG